MDKSDFVYYGTWSFIAILILTAFGFFIYAWSGISISVQHIRDYERSHESYSGKVVFYNEEDYGEFKLELAKPEVDFNSKNILVLSSEPPIVVQFYVNVPNGYKFPYGEIAE